ncbi:DUF6603 domain-containing protein [Kitasatospora kifunensis]|uniref:DUF6603 domain-containing protein n=1 Tax=Kitasatospora kifunensis TaxID=58351 RepID=A0A7W7VYT0_KITKI|nr:DUF6603 domain-containing protein [Kitasatospora kifunensis]MBB4927373.1 hypothetical protein [Kitasatospora kifunensis]
MPVAIADLLASFPDPGDDFVLPLDSIELPELYQLFSAGKDFVLRVTEAIRAELTVIGTAALLNGREALLRFEFLADAAGQYVAGLKVGIEVAVGLVELAEAWELDLSEVPQAFLAEVQKLLAQYDLTHSQVVIGAETEHLRLVFAAPSIGGPLVALVGVKESGALLSELPHVGGEIPDGELIGVHGVEAIVVSPGGISAAQGAAVNAAVASVVEQGQWWPLLPEQALAAGVWVGACYQLPTQEAKVWAVRLTVPEIGWVPDFPSLPLGRFTLSGLGLRWPLTGSGGGGGGGGSGLGVYFDLSIKLGWLNLQFPDVGFDFSLPDLPDAGGFSILPRLPSICLSVGDVQLTFKVPKGPNLPELPGFPELPSLGLLTGWWDSAGGGGGDTRLLDLLALFDLSLPSLPDLFNPKLPSLGLRIDLAVGDFELIGEFGALRFVLGGLPPLSGPEGWGKIALLGIKGLSGWLTELPFIGSLFEGLPDLLLNGISLAGLGSGISLPQLELLNGWIGSFPSGPGGWWPSLNWESSGGGAGKPGWSLDVNWQLPDRPALEWGMPWPPPLTPPELSWLPFPDLPIGPLTISGIGLSWPALDEPDWNFGTDWVLRVVLDVKFVLGGGISLGLTGLGFDIDLKKFEPHPRFPRLSLTLPSGFEMDFTVPMPTGPVPPIALTARWRAEDEDGVPADQLMLGLGAELAKAIPDQLMPRLHSVGLRFDFRNYEIVVAATSSFFGWMLAVQPANEPQRRRYLVAVRSTVQAKASDLPIVDLTDPDHDVIVRDIQFAWAGMSEDAPPRRWTAAEVLELNELLAEFGADPAVADADPMASGLLPVLLPGDFEPETAVIWAKLNFGGSGKLELVYPADREFPVLGQGGGVVLGRERAEEEARRFDGYAIGPVRFSHAALGYAHGQLFIAFDATMAVGPLTIELLGLGLGVDKDWKIGPVLRGASLALERPGPPKVVISGAFTRLDMGPDYELAFGAAGKIELLDLFVMQLTGSWAKHKDGWDSIFAYAELVAGKAMVNGLFSIGPVTFTGVVLGFGINSTVRIPTTGELGEFPLIQRLGAQEGEPKKTPAQALESLVGTGGWVKPARGQYWVAGGMEFTVYRFIEARALALVEWGEAGWKVMLAGSTTLPLPPKLPTSSKAGAGAPLAVGSLCLGKVIVDFVYVYDSALGRFSMDTVIAKGSYILDPDAQLTGGISLYVWGKDLPSQGIGKGFVLSAGGYHPQFKVPAHYPKPPRIGWLWERGPVSIKAHAYAALTDGAFMIGGALEAVYDNGHGINLRAWFTAHLDALVQWKPFYADVAFGLSIGVAATVKVLFVRVRVSLEVSVSLQLWLPPIGGRAKVKVWFISFTIGFGADREGAPPVPWEDFRIQLPAPSRTALKQGGELPDVTKEEFKARSEANLPELVRIDGFSVSVESALPASKITLNDDLFAGSEDARIDIRPMRLTGVVCEQIVEILDQRGNKYDWEAEGWKVSATTEGMPQALWGAPLDNPDQALKQPGLVPDRLTGLTIVVPGPTKQLGVGDVPSKALDVEGLPSSRMPLRDSAVAGESPVADEGSVGVITSTLVATKDKRTLLHQALAGLGVAPGSDGPLNQSAKKAGKTLTDPPLLTAAAR